MLTVGQALRLAAARHGDKVALVFEDQTKTFRELDETANRWANTLALQGIRKGDRVALLLPNGLEMAEAYFGAARAGVIGVPINLRWTPQEMGFAVRHAEVSGIITDPELLPLAQAGAGTVPVWTTGPAGTWTQRVLGAGTEMPDIVVQDADPWVLIFTSGTTGRPKGAVRSHYSNLMIALLLAAELGISGDDTGLAILPMFHVNSMWFVTLSVILGATCVIYPYRTFHPARLVGELNRHRVTYSMFIPTILTYLADGFESGAFTCPDLRVVMTASAPLDTHLRDRLMQALPSAHLVDIYGATEYGAVTYIRHRAGGPIGSVGLPLVGQSLAILDDSLKPVPPGQPGEIFVKGPCLMDGYWRQPDATAAATVEGYLSVGDMGFLAEDGLLYLLDRKQDMIIMAGENVYPVEVENVLLEDPAVAQTVVFGAPDPRRGERVVALVVPRPSATVDVEALHERCRRQLADYKRPAVIATVEELPQNATGKVVRRLAREAWLSSQG